MTFKTRVKSNPYMNSVQHVHYLRTGNSIEHRPCTDKKGIHCEGDKFGYVVDWQVSEKKQKIVFAK